MKKILNTLFILSCLFLFTLFSNCSGKGDSRVTIKTSYGDMKVMLYDKTPLHKENFLKLVDSGFYNNTLFHRVIKEFMIQGGDPTSIGAPEGIQLGSGGPGYTLPAEFDTNLFHKKGALSAARQGDQINPERRSSGSQFFIVQGKAYSPEELNNIEMRINYSNLEQYIRTELIMKDSLMMKKIMELQESKNTSGLNDLSIVLQEKALHDFDSLDLHFKFTDTQKEVYTTIGGAPFLDGQYTVFGEVVEGLDVIDKISDVETDSFNRPKEDISITIKK